MRANVLRTEVERFLLAEFSSRSQHGFPGVPDESVLPARITAVSRPDLYAARIARAIADQLWP
jgi:hypothetical protein